MSENNKCKKNNNNKQKQRERTCFCKNCGGTYAVRDHTRYSTSDWAGKYFFFLKKTIKYLIKYFGVHHSKEKKNDY